MSEHRHSGCQTQSIWAPPIRSTQRPPLDRDAIADVCIVGAGIAGLSAALQLAREGRRVIVLDDGPIGGGETGRTTAHLSSAIDDRYCRIEQVHGSEAARITYESHDAAIRWIERAVLETGVACAFERVPGYLFLPPGGDPELLERELDAAHRAGFYDVALADAAPLSQYNTGPCLVFPRQGQFDPLAFLHGIAAAIEQLGGRICCGTHARHIENGGGVAIRCDRDLVVRANDVVFATNSPVNDRVTLHTKQHAYRTYAIGLPVVTDSVPHALFWDTSQTADEPDGPYHYARLRPAAADGQAAIDGRETLIVGGEDHKTGQENDAEARWARLEQWARERFPVSGGPVTRWSGQVLEPVDHVAFIGRNPTGPDHVYVVTGDSGMGMTHSAIAAMLLSDLIAGRENEWARLYDPARRTLRTAWTYARENLNMAAQYTDWVRPGTTDSTDSIAAGSGALVRHGLKLSACYRDPSGELHELSAVCPHLGGIVRWNAAENTWDCPCHGSRFSARGEVLNGPAVSPLEPVHETAGVHHSA